MEELCFLDDQVSSEYRLPYTKRVVNPCSAGIAPLHGKNAQIWALNIFLDNIIVMVFFLLFSFLLSSVKKFLIC